MKQVHINSIFKHYKPEKSNGAFNEKHIEYKKSDGNVSIKLYLKTYLGTMIDELKKSGEWKIHLTMKVNFTPSKDNDYKKFAHSKSSNITIMGGNKTDEIINVLFEFLLTRYELGRPMLITR